MAARGERCHPRGGGWDAGAAARGSASAFPFLYALDRAALLIAGFDRV